MKRLPWIIVALLPASFGFIDLNSAANPTIWALIAVGALCCITGVCGLLVGAIKNPWLLSLVTLFLSCGFFAMDTCISIYVGCTYHPPHFE